MLKTLVGFNNFSQSRSSISPDSLYGSLTAHVIHNIMRSILAHHYMGTNTCVHRWLISYFRITTGAITRVSSNRNAEISSTVFFQIEQNQLHIDMSADPFIVGLLLRWAGQCKSHHMTAGQDRTGWTYLYIYIFIFDGMGWNGIAWSRLVPWGSRSPVIDNPWSITSCSHKGLDFSLIAFDTVFHGTRNRKRKKKCITHQYL